MKVQNVIRIKRFKVKQTMRISFKKRYFNQKELENDKKNIINVLIV